MSKAGFTGSDDDLIQFILHIQRRPSSPHGEMLSRLMRELLDRRTDHAALNNQAQDLSESNRRLEEAIEAASKERARLARKAQLLEGQNEALRLENSRLRTAIIRMQGVVDSFSGSVPESATKLTLSILQSLHQRTRQLKFAVARAAEAVEPQ